MTLPTQLVAQLLIAAAVSAVNIEKVVAGWNAAVPAIPSVHNFGLYYRDTGTDGYGADEQAATNHVDDGGNDAYDSGNYLSVQAINTTAAQELEYTDACDDSDAFTATGSGDIMYKTCRLDNAVVSVFTSASSSINKFSITGGLGADGDGRVFWNTDPLTITGFAAEAWYKSVSEATFGETPQKALSTAEGVCPSPFVFPNDYCVVQGAETCERTDPSVSHLIITEPGATHTASCDTDLDLDVLEWNEGVGVKWLVQLAWGGSSCPSCATTLDYDRNMIPTLHLPSDFQKVFAAIAASNFLNIRSPPPPPPPPPPKKAIPKFATQGEGTLFNGEFTASGTVEDCEANKDGIREALAEAIETDVQNVNVTACEAASVKIFFSIFEGTDSDVDVAGKLANSATLTKFADLLKAKTDMEVVESPAITSTQTVDAAGNTGTPRPVYLTLALGLGLGLGLGVCCVALAIVAGVLLYRRSKQQAGQPTVMKTVVAA